MKAEKGFPTVFCVAHTFMTMQDNYLMALESREEAEQVFKGLVNQLKEDLTGEVYEDSDSEFYFEGWEGTERVSIFEIHRRYRSGYVLADMM
tara:strand:- start:3739 stop:4014 length:276 start_codon:yes stop_codon:yes gene_type:complete